MKALRILQWGAPVQLEEIAVPKIAPDEMLVRVHAASLNPADLAVVTGYFQNMLTVPMTPGSDFAGEVVEVGDQVEHVKAADAVYGMIPYRGGTFAEYVVAKIAEVAPKPTTLDFVHAAAVPMTALTAWQALFDVAHLQAGERVLILGAGGSVGSFAVQFAKEQGAEVIGIASAKDIPFLQQDLGLDQVVEYQAFEQMVADVDVVFNTANHDFSTRAYNVLKPGGRLVSIVGQPPEEAAERLGIYATMHYAGPSSEQLTTIAALIDAGKVKVRVQQTFPLSEGQAALDLKQKGKTSGKFVLSIV